MRGGYRKTLLAASAAVLLAGCGQTFDATRLGVPVTMASAAATPADGDKFTLYSHATFALWGVVRLSQPSLRKALASQVGAGTGVADLKIRMYSSFTDVLVTMLTLGVVVPRTVVYEGVVTGAATAPVAPAAK